MQVGIQKKKIKMYGLVRDENGKPKIDGDPKLLHPEIKKLMTAEERKEFGVD